ncbi:MAG: PadR family transcriptional regulator [Ardenticatenaceae bacterium]|nr:PadR family transcriptional regulator [Anaerolineales bacterium]MCB8923786.1 PadR family transcriptional regulator [Ardenticatenaceae bacterium]MCB8990121.1 PadR family transcriptional regulator [Ardenticatenaceae bacterium]
MSLEQAILGFLNYRPYSGYDLKKIFDTSVRHFWPADQSQIYRTLSRMNKEGWVDIEMVHQESRPDRKLYHITTAGQEALRQWLATPLPPQENRSADMIQVFFAGQLADEEILALFERAADNIRAGLARYAQIPREIEAYSEYTTSPREFFFWMLTLDVGMHTLQANLAFIEALIQRIRNGEIPAA